MSDLRNILSWLERHLQMSIPKQAEASGVDPGTLRRWLNRPSTCPQPLKSAAYMAFLRRCGMRLNPAVYHGDGSEVYWIDSGEGTIPHDWDVTLYVSDATRAYMVIYWHQGALMAVTTTEQCPYLHLDEMYEDLASLAVMSVERQMMDAESAA